MALSMVPALGPRRMDELIAHFGSAAGAVDAGESALREVPMIGKVLAGRVAASGLLDRARAALEWGRARKIRVLVPEDEAFPGLLREIADPPRVLWVRGELPREEVRIAIVGTRRTSPYGLRVARELAEGLADRGAAVVSGLAIGADAAAHQGALETGRTIAVMATGPDRVYPGRHRGLADRIRRSGALVTEFAPGTPARRGNFPARNRLISGLSRGTVVVESARRGGSMITAYLASDQNRELFAVPGPANARTSAGPHDLIRRSYAKLVETAEDVLEEIRPMVRDGVLGGDEVGESEAGADGKEARRENDPAASVPGRLAGLYEAVGPEPRHLDEIGRAARVEPPHLLVGLLELEMCGAVRQLAGQQFVRT